MNIELTDTDTTTIIAALTEYMAEAEDRAIGHMKRAASARSAEQTMRYESLAEASRQCADNAESIGERLVEAMQAHEDLPVADLEPAPAPVRVPDHNQDEDCTLDHDKSTCAECGVFHGAPCLDCDGRGFHRPGCAE